MESSGQNQRNVFKTVREKYFQLKILHSADLLVKCKRGIKTFSDMQRIQKYAFHVSLFSGSYCRISSINMRA